MAAHVLTGKGKHGFSDKHRGQLMVLTGTFEVIAVRHRLTTVQAPCSVQAKNWQKQRLKHWMRKYNSKTSQSMSFFRCIIGIPTNPLSPGARQRKS